MYTPDRLLLGIVIGLIIIIFRRERAHKREIREAEERNENLLRILCSREASGYSHYSERGNRHGC